jgi:phosphomannomutase
LFSSEGIGKVAINDLSPNAARTIAVEFARRIAVSATHAGKNQPVTIIIASDGRLATAAIVAAIVEGVRWTGCEALDLGLASAPCTASAIQHAMADGGIFIGNAYGAAHTVGLKFWTHDEPLSEGGLLEEIENSILSASGTQIIDRPTRKFGTLRRFTDADFYLDGLRPAYHALRPLRFVLNCPTGPMVGYLEELMRNVACRAIPGETGMVLGEQVVAARAHFGMQIDDDGENCQVVDERGQTVAAERLLALVGGSLTGPILHGDKLRHDTFRRMRKTQAALGIDVAGRLWYATGHAPLPDALRTLTHLVVHLSRNDRPFSAVLDQEAPAV